MQKAQVFLREDQKSDLEAIAKRTGRKQSELIRSGVDLVIEQEKTRSDWRAGFRQAAGIWRDRDDIPELMAETRAQLRARDKRHGS